jgi:phosphoserine phosphatase
MAEMAATYFPSWNPQSPTLAQLVSFVDEVTNPASADYVDPEARVATFDMDGTFISEKAPVYIGFCLLFHRVLDDPTYQAPPEMRELVEQARSDADQGIVNDERSVELNRLYPQAFAGMEQAEFHAYVQQFLDTVPVDGFEGMTYGGSFYQPMLEVIRYLQDHDFEVYIVSGSSRESVRAICVPLGIAPDHIIGTDISLVATGQGDQDGVSYTFVPADKLLTGTNMYDECLKTNKVIRIATEIGRRPILSFGNSSGDVAMMEYVISDNPYKSASFMVLDDDATRDHGDPEEATSKTCEYEELGFTTISMANDFATIYGDDVEIEQK